MTYKEAARKAALAAILFFCFGLAGIFWPGRTTTNFSLTIFYLILVLNTYFSLRSFGQIIPAKNVRQNILDTLLLVLYAGLASRFANILHFAIIAALLFAVSTLKYTPFLSGGSEGRRALIKRKVRANILGTLSSLCAAGGVLIGYGATMSTLWAILFAGTSIYFLAVRPLYPPNVPA